MRMKVGFVAVAVVLALLGFAVAGAVAHGAAFRHTDATTVTEPTSSSTTTKLAKARAAIRLFKNTQG